MDASQVEHLVASLVVDLVAQKVASQVEHWVALLVVWMVDLKDA